MDLMPSPHATRGYDDFLGVDGLLGGDGRSMMTQENRGGEMYASIERPPNPLMFCTVLLQNAEERGCLWSGLTFGDWHEGGMSAELF